MDKLDELSQRLDRIEFTLDRFIEYTLKRDAGDFDRDVAANLTADALFEWFVNRKSFFDK